MTFSRPLFTLALLLAFAPAHAQERTAPPVFLGALAQPNGKFQVKFVLAKDAGNGRFEPVRAITVEPGDAQGSCVIRPTTDLRMPDAYWERPVFDPANSTSRLAAGDDVPAFFGRTVIALLSRPGIGMAMPEIRPYSACARSLWTELLNRPAG